MILGVIQYRPFESFISFLGFYQRNKISVFRLKNPDFFGNFFAELFSKEIATHCYPELPKIMNQIMKTYLWPSQLISDIIGYKWTPI